MDKLFTPKDIEKLIMRLYLDVKTGDLYEDKACKEVYLLNALLRAMEIQIKKDDRKEESRLS